ncbi:copper amine oxidase N-terminal domain-containing protein [Heliorestis convoluta]|uniref:Copper amine oxidase N-terminal domain-containing protein n=1 Tax=Heliorestis convoluta TaxID=356322 RepID=A0A5Q2N0L8_9FIRM|nr:copper amine oxidase N-terminal domain-containing protein [Heliorestis convoluta]QGG46812.1 copper amine oxidase N-terminal domain-containing protein [Heliorestis convoluta]
MSTIKHIRGAIAGALTVTLLTIPGIAGANNLLIDKGVSSDHKRDVIEIIEKVEEERYVEIEVETSAIGSFTGKVKEITEHYVGALKIFLENDQGQEAHLIVSQQTYVAGKEQIKLGDMITGYYDANKPIIMIYPPQYAPELIVFENSDGNVKVEVFDENLLSKDQALKLTIDEEREILYPSGAPYKGDLTDKTLAVFYDFSTRSIPPQTTPIKIIVLFEKEPTTEEILQLDFSHLEYMVNHQVVKAAEPYADEKGTIMVPLRSIAEALGYSVTWDGRDQSITVGQDFSLQIGKDAYTSLGIRPIELGTAPVLKDNTTYVPLHFFREVVAMNNAYVFEGQIVINNDEKME